MNFVKFVDNRFQELKQQEMALEKEKKYSITGDAEVLSLQAVLGAVRTLAKWALIFKVLGHYILVELHIAREPEAVILNKIQADEDAKKAQAQKDLEAKAKKVGMLQMVENKIAQQDPAPLQSS